MKLKTLFTEYVSKWFSKLVKALPDTINGKKEEKPKYLFMQWLKREFSVDLKWSSIRGKYSSVMADVVSLDSELPLKKRDSLEKAEGEIPKLGMKKYLNEKQLSDIDTMKAKGGLENQIVSKLFADAKACITGIYERLEFMFLQALSTGVTLIEDENNTGVGVRLDFQIPSSNVSGVAYKWRNPDAKPLNDIERIIDLASSKGDTITHLLMSKSTSRRLRDNKQVKDAYAAYIDANNVNQRITQSKLNEYLSDEYGVEIVIIDRSVVVEKNGKRETIKPWKEDAVTFVTSLDLGSLMYGQLAEENHPAKQVDYEKADEFILVSKYHTNDPLREYTSSQANVCPVLNNVDSIYILNSDDALELDNADKGNEEDANITVFGHQKTKTEVLNALKELGIKTNANWKDSTVIEKINELSDEDEAKLKKTLSIS